MWYWAQCNLLGKVSCLLLEALLPATSQTLQTPAAATLMELVYAQRINLPRIDCSLRKACPWTREPRTLISLPPIMVLPEGWAWHQLAVYTFSWFYTCMQTHTYVQVHTHPHSDTQRRVCTHTYTNECWLLFLLREFGYSLNLIPQKRE